MKARLVTAIVYNIATTALTYFSPPDNLTFRITKIIRNIDISTFIIRNRQSTFVKGYFYVYNGRLLYRFL